MTTQSDDNLALLSETVNRLYWMEQSLRGLPVADIEGRSELVQLLKTCQVSARRLYASQAMELGVGPEPDSKP